MSQSVTLWLDLRSPYSYVAHVRARAIEQQSGVRFERHPFMLKIGAGGGDPQLWQRRIRYLYMDVRRFAAPLGLTIRGPTRIYDPILAAACCLFAARQGALETWLDLAYARFFDRALEIDDRAAMTATLREAGIDIAGLPAWLDGPAAAELAALQQQAEKQGVFGVPTFVLGAELFWGQDRIELLQQRLAAGRQTQGEAGKAASEPG